MDEEYRVPDSYLRLSFTAGFLVELWDHHLGYTHFHTRAHFFEWTLTWDILKEWTEEARRLGVPEEKLVLPADISAWVGSESFIRMARESQKIADLKMILKLRLYADQEQTSGRD